MWSVQGISILGAPETAFSHVPGKPVTDNPLVANGHASLVAAIQVIAMALTARNVPETPCSSPGQAVKDPQIEC